MSVDGESGSFIEDGSLSKKVKSINLGSDNENLFPIFRFSFLGSGMPFVCPD
jgi:hypothetical protein